MTTTATAIQAAKTSMTVEASITRTAQANSVATAAAARHEGLKALDEQRDQLNAAFAQRMRELIADDDSETISSASQKTGLSRQHLHDLLRRYPEATSA